MVLKIQKQYSI